MMNDGRLKAKDIMDRDCNVISACSTRPYPLVVERGKGARIFDIEGNEYIDLVAGFAVMNVGHANPDVNAAVSEQMGKMSHCGFHDFFAEPPLKLAEKLRQLTGYDRVFFCNSGTEAVEAAIKLATWKTKRQNLIAFYNAFHGRTIGSLSLTCSKIGHKVHFPSIRVVHSHYAYCYRCPLNLEYPDCGIECAKLIEEQIFKRELSHEDTAAVFVEPIQGEGGYIVPPREFHQEVRRICDDNNVLLVADEVQTGCYRTGTFMAMEYFGVRADIICMAKALGSGLPLGVMLAGHSLMDWPPGTHANTFGGNLLASSASLAGIEFLEREKIGDHAREIGKYMMGRLREMQEDHPLMGDVRGLGLMIGVEIVRADGSPDPRTRDQLILELFKEGVLLLSCGDSVIRISPPLVITKEEADLALDRFEDALGRIGQRR